MNSVLSLDLGTTTGWALKDQNNNIISGFISFKPQRFEGGGMRFLRFKRWLEEIHATAGKIDVIYFEEVRRHLGVDAAHTYGGFLAILSTFANEREIPFSGIPVGTIKRFITGKGNASKDLMIAAVKERGYNNIQDDNEADAIAILLCGLNG